MDKVVFREILRKTDFYNRIPTKGCSSSCNRYIKIDLDKEIRKVLNLEFKLKGRCVRKSSNHAT